MGFSGPLTWIKAYNARLSSRSKMSCAKLGRCVGLVGRHLARPRCALRQSAAVRVFVSAPTTTCYWSGTDLGLQFAGGPNVRRTATTTIASQPSSPLSSSTSTRLQVFRGQVSNRIVVFKRDTSSAIRGCSTSSAT